MEKDPYNDDDHDEPADAMTKEFALKSHENSP
jgi:hypothetical protein